MPISSASLNLTPGDTLARSSSSTRSPAASRSAASSSAAGLCGPPSLPAITTMWTSAGAISRGQQQADVVERSPRRSPPAQRETPTPYEPMVGVTGLSFSSLHGELERLGVLAAELEDVADLDAAGDLDGRATRRADVAVEHFGGLDRAVASEVATGDQIDHVMVVVVGAGDPGGAVDDARVEQVSDARCVVRPERRRGRCSPSSATGAS